MVETRKPQISNTPAAPPRPGGFVVDAVLAEGPRGKIRKLLIAGKTEDALGCLAADASVIPILHSLTRPLNPEAGQDNTGIAAQGALEVFRIALRRSIRVDEISAFFVSYLTAYPDTGARSAYELLASAAGKNSQPAIHGLRRIIIEARSRCQWAHELSALVALSEAAMAGNTRAIEAMAAGLSSNRRECVVVAAKSLVAAAKTHNIDVAIPSLEAALQREYKREPLPMPDTMVRIITVVEPFQSMVRATDRDETARRNLERYLFLMDAAWRIKYDIANAIVFAAANSRAMAAPPSSNMADAAFVRILTAFPAGYARLFQACETRFSQGMPEHPEADQFWGMFSQPGPATIATRPARPGELSDDPDSLGRQLDEVTAAPTHVQATGQQTANRAGTNGQEAQEAEPGDDVPFPRFRKIELD